MNTTFHIVRKDLRICRWWFALWVSACLAHLLLRIYQLRFGDTVVDSGFWSFFEGTGRVDWMLVLWLPLLVIPFFMHADPLVKREAFWKTLPISRTRLLVAKLAIVIALFVLLPLACELVYIVVADLSSVLPELIFSWARRFAVLVAVVSFACLVTPGMLWGLPVTAVIYGILLFGTREDPVRIPYPSSMIVKNSGRPPEGCRIVVRENSVVVESINQETTDALGGNRKIVEQCSFSGELSVESLPEELLVDTFYSRFMTLESPDRGVIMNFGDGSSQGFSADIVPLQERGGGRQGINRNNPPRSWKFHGAGKFSARVIPEDGCEVTGMVTVALAKKRLVHTMDLAKDRNWRSGLERYSLRMSPNSRPGNFVFTTALGQPWTGANESWGMGSRAPGNTVVWLANKEQPYALLMQNTNGNRYSPDVTRYRRLIQEEWQVGEDSGLVPRSGPLARMRFNDDQGSINNWQLEFIRYEPAGTIEIPFRMKVQRPNIIPEKSLRDEDDEFVPPPPYAQLLKAVQVPESIGAEDAVKAFNSIRNICTMPKAPNLEAIARPMLERLARSQPKLLLEEARNATDGLRDVETATNHQSGGYLLANYGSDYAVWKRRTPELRPFWKMVLRALVTTSRPDQKDLFLAYLSPRLDLTPAVELHGWESDALPRMQQQAMTMPVPASWQEAIRRRPSKAGEMALLRQIRMGSMEFFRMRTFIENGAVDSHSGAKEAWEAAVEFSSIPWEIKETLLIALKHGVGIAPRDLWRMMKTEKLDINGDGKTRRRFFVGLVQGLSLRSDCPGELGPAIDWLEKNASSLVWNPVNGYYEIPGGPVHGPRIQVTAETGTWIDPMGVGTLLAKDGGITITSRALGTGMGNLRSERSTPRLVKKAEGDFTAEITLDFPLQPGVGWGGSKDELHESAGLVLEAGYYRFITINKFYQGNGNSGMWEDFHRHVNTNQGAAIHGTGWDVSKPVRMKISRHRGWFYTAWKQGEGSWVESPAIYGGEWDNEITVGPYLRSNVMIPVEARFSGFTVTSGSEPPARISLGKFDTPGITPTVDGHVLEGWGTVSNPVANGEFRIERDSLVVRSAAGVGSWSQETGIQAPAVLEKVSGDFTYEVTLPPAPEAWGSAAVVILCDAAKTVNYRVGQGTFRSNGRHWLDHLGWELDLPSVDYPIDPEKPLRIKIQRQGPILRVFTRQGDQQDWSAFSPTSVATWPVDLEVGVSVPNDGPKESLVRFENPVLKQGGK